MALARPARFALLLLLVTGEAHAVLQSSSAMPPLYPRHEYPLSCRGGEEVMFDTLSVSSTPDVVTLSLGFIASPSAAGHEGQGLPPSTCAWVDRPLNDAEPRQVRVTLSASDSTPRASVRDTGVYWSFLAYNSDSGHITAVGYRTWHASSPPKPWSPDSATLVSSAEPRPRFNPKYLLWFVLGWIVIAWVPMLTLTGHLSGWRRVARTYPDRNSGRGRSFRSGPILMGRSNYRGWGRLTTDESHLHFAVGAILRAGHPPFSVPWRDITASRDEWPWSPFKGHPVIRLTLARHPGLRILVPVAAGERIAAESGGRLTLDGSRLHAAAFH